MMERLVVRGVYLAVKYALASRILFFFFLFPFSSFPFLVRLELQNTLMGNDFVKFAKK